LKSRPYSFAILSGFLCWLKIGRQFEVRERTIHASQEQLFIHFSNDSSHMFLKRFSRID